MSTPDLATFTARDVRAWAIENDIDCPRVGIVPRRIIDAYLEAVHGTAVADDEASDDEPEWTIDLRIPGADAETVATIETLLMDVVWHAYAAGMQAQREQTNVALRSLLGGDS